jgi:hypothetical protein
MIHRVTGYLTWFVGNSDEPIKDDLSFRANSHHYIKGEAKYIRIQEYEGLMYELVPSNESIIGYLAISHFGEEAFTHPAKAYSMLLDLIRYRAKFNKPTFLGFAYKDQDVFENVLQSLLESGKSEAWSKNIVRGFMEVLGIESYSPSADKRS